jgi:hypothetical protein
MAAAIGQAARLDPARCRAHVEMRFSAARMISDYESIYCPLAGHIRDWRHQSLGHLSRAAAIAIVVTQRD